MRHQCAQERNIVANAFNREGIKRFGLAFNRLDARWPVCDELGDHRIIIHRDLPAFLDTRIIAHGDGAELPLCRWAIGGEAANRGHEIAGWIFGINAAFHRPTVQFDVALCITQRFAIGDADHFLNQIDPRDQLRHGMFHLQTRIHFEEIEALVLPGDEFHCASGVVIHGFCQRDGLRAHFRACCLIKQRRRCFFDYFLIAALHRAFALAQMDDIAVLVAQHLNFNVARIDDEFLNEHPVIPEGGCRLGFGPFKPFLHFISRPCDAHALAAAASGCLDHHGIADLTRDYHRMGSISNFTQIPRNRGHTGSCCRFFGFDLIAHSGDGMTIGADKGDAGISQSNGEGFTLAQKAITWMHGFGAGLLAGINDFLDHKIGFGGSRRADEHSLIRHRDMHRILIGFGIDGNRLDSHSARGFDNAAGDFTPIGNQNFGKHADPLCVDGMVLGEGERPDNASRLYL